MFKVGDEVFIKTPYAIKKEKIIRVDRWSYFMDSGFAWNKKAAAMYLFRTKKDLANREIKRLQEKIKDLKNEMKTWESYNERWKNRSGL